MSDYCTQIDCTSGVCEFTLIVCVCGDAQVQRAYNRFYTQQQSRSRQCVNTFADMSQVPQSLQLPFLLILTAYGVKPVNIPHRLRLRLAQQRPWQQDLPSIVLD